MWGHASTALAASRVHRVPKLHALSLQHLKIGAQKCRYYLEDSNLNFRNIDRHLRCAKTSSNQKYLHLKNVERFGERASYMQAYCCNAQPDVLQLGKLFLLFLLGLFFWHPGRRAHVKGMDLFTDSVEPCKD